MAIHYLRTDETITFSGDDETPKVVLAPSLYWYLHARFPTRSMAKARRLADSIMDSRPASYQTLFLLRRNEGYDCYAYDEEALQNRLAAEGLTEAKRYFLQQFADQMPRRIDEKTIADVVEGICLELPDDRSDIPSLADLDFEDVRSFAEEKKRADFKRPGIALLLLLIVTMSLDLGLRLQRKFAIETRLDQSRTDRSIYEIRALVNKYEKIARKQERLRRSIAETLQKRLKKLSCDADGGCRDE